MQQFRCSPDPNQAAVDKFVAGSSRRADTQSDTAVSGIRRNRNTHGYTDAKVAELADAPDLGSGGATRGGSSPPFRTKILVHSFSNT